MKILLYQGLSPEKIPGFAKFRTAIAADDFTQAQVCKIDKNLYRARLNRSDRLLFSLYSFEGHTYCLVLEYIANHAYDKSRFLNRNVNIDAAKVPLVEKVESLEFEPLVYLNTDSDCFNLLDRILSFDNEQKAIYDLQPPLVIIGSAGSGKTALTLEKMKHAIGDVLYVSLSEFLVKNARNIYYANGYANEDQVVEFFSFREFLESIKVPQGKEITLRVFDEWFNRHKAGTGLKDSHKLFEEFRGVLTGAVTDTPWLSRQEYLSLGIKQSIYSESERSKVYDLFEKYCQYLEQNHLFDPNILSHAYLSEIAPCYDFIVIDEVQDLTSIQLYLILKCLRTAGEFLLCGDSNQIVHPNFFSWSKVKTLFFKEQSLVTHNEVIRILHTNYRNSEVITEVANRILKLKQARFGSIDKESNYLVKSISKKLGTVQLLEDQDKIKQDLDAKTARSAHFAVLVMHPHQKAQARQWFNTPLIFSIQEAKGLEYENVVLLNFINEEEKAFQEIASGVDPSDLDKSDLKYARAKNKNDKSLEIYKFFINALYVAITRAVKNLYWVEANQKHPLMNLLQLERFYGDLSLEKQDSSLEEWQKEARRLELQGKQEQAEEIRSRILQQKPVPWPVLDRTAFSLLKEKALSTATGNKKDRLRVFEYALLYHDKSTLNELKAVGFKPALQKSKRGLEQLINNHYLSYELKHPRTVLSDTERYGVDHRTVFNLTPLMVSARVGNVHLVEQLIERGADPDLVGSNGLNALQMALELAFADDKYVRDKIARIYPLLEPDSLTVQVQGKLVKLDKRLMALFIFNVMFALFYPVLGEAACVRSAFTAKDIVQQLQKLPESVLSKRRKRQTYISSVLSSNEVNRDYKYNRKLFVRIQRGHYVINPNLKIRLSEEWVPVYELLRLDDLGFNAKKTYGLGGSRHHSDSTGFISHLEEIDRIYAGNLDRFRRTVQQLIEDVPELEEESLS